jgi:hypothetical protein
LAYLACFTRKPIRAEVFSDSSQAFGLFHLAFYLSNRFNGPYGRCSFSFRIKDRSTDACDPDIGFVGFDINPVFLDVLQILAYDTFVLTVNGVR